MMTSSRPRDQAAGTFGSRRGHTSQLSISDPSHHVTEAIGTLYGDEDDSGFEGGGRPLSFLDGSSYHEEIEQPSYIENRNYSSSRSQQHRITDYDSRRPLTRSVSDELYGSPCLFDEQGTALKKSQTLHMPSSNHRSSSQFPLTNIDNPSDIAQELSNLQALRRMSMDVGNSIDPDMPPMGLSAMPVIAPTGNDDENDPSRLLWVPARVHPELAPSEFKSFLENRVQLIRRRSGESFLSPDSDLKRSDSDSLRRRKSLLSRQIDNSGGQGAVGYVDGAERLDRKRLSGGSRSPELSLDDLVKNPTRAVQKFAQESQGGSLGEGTPDDMPILPMAPGMGLRRSTRTTYRKGGSLRSGDRVPFSKRMAQRQQETDSRDMSAPFDSESSKGHSLDRVQSEPTAENYSRPKRSIRKQHSSSQGNVTESNIAPEDGAVMPLPSMQEPLSVRTKPQPATSQTSESSSQDGGSGNYNNQSATQFPQRSSSQIPGSTQQEPEVVVEEAFIHQPSRHSAPVSNNHTIHKQSPQVQYSSKSSAPSRQQSCNDKFGSSSTLMSGDASRTDNLTVIPTFNQADRKPEKKSRKDKDDDSASTSSKSGGAWKWLKGVTDDKDKKRDENRKAKAKASVDKASDNARLDVIQNSIEKTAVKGRESLVLDRDNVDSKLLDERKKESQRKSDSKKEKDGSIFSSIFGGSKRKEEREKATKKSQHLQVPEEPVYKPLLPDVDYNWTRFPLLEERAIYRMAHIKLANPRRPLLSQVLLSNFMYSYLAIVQAMHPQMNVPTSPQQKRLEEEARRKQREQERASRQQIDDEDAENSLEQYNFDYHRATVQYAESGSVNQPDYVDEARIYEDEHGNNNQEEYGCDNQEGYGQGVKDYYQYQSHDSDHRRHGGDSMW